MRYLSVTADAVLLILAVLVIGLPEARTTPVQICLALVYFFVAGRDFRAARKAGLMKMTVGQICRTAGDRPRSTLLSFAASMIGFIALMVSMT